jgi:putative peptidoglycan lipid II flippase
MLALPAAVALWVLAIPLISTLYQYGRFTASDVLQTRTALLGYSVGLLGLIAVKILAPGFYARQMMATPVKIAFATVLVSQTFAVILMFPLGHAGLTLSTSIGACMNAGLLFWFLRKRGIYAPRPGWPMFVAKLAVALFALAAALLWLGGPASFWLAASFGRRSPAGCRRLRAAGASSLFPGPCGCSNSASPNSTAGHHAREARIQKIRVDPTFPRCGQRGFTHSA